MRATDKLPPREAYFVEPMECVSVAKLIDGPQWVFELKLDGYRAIAVKGQAVNLFSRRRKSFNRQYPYIVEALSDLPEGTVLDGEVVAQDDSGRPNFNLLQHSRVQSSQSCDFQIMLQILVQLALQSALPSYLPALGGPRIRGLTLRATLDLGKSIANRNGLNRIHRSSWKILLRQCASQLSHVRPAAWVSGKVRPADEGD